MCKLFVYITIPMLILAFPGAVCAEYIRATNEEEIILVSTESEVNMGKSLAKSVEKKFKLVENSYLQKRINDIGQKIVAVCDRKDIAYHFNVLKGEELKPEERINAFALPGGYVYIFEDMVKLMENDDEIAGILAHEVGHIAAKHSVKKLQGSLGAMAFQLLTSRIDANQGSRKRAYAAIGLLMTSYSREDETTADTLSVKYLKKAGYEPEAILNLMDKMMDMHNKMPIRKFTYYRTHPYLAERKAVVKKEIYGQMDFADFMNAPVISGEK